MDRILVIDDIEQNVELMVNHLRDAGYDVITAADGISGIKKAKIFTPDLIVMDLLMPKMSGFDVCRTLKTDDATKDILILVVDSLPSKDSRNRSFDVGADEYMEKTFDKSVFLAKIKSLLRVKSLSDKLKENYAVLEEQNKQFEMQLETARHIQSVLVSELDFTCNGVEIASRYCPAHSVSGDFYEVQPLNEDCVSVFIADVSGYGVSAALLTSMLKIMFKQIVDIDIAPDKLLTRMNEEFCSVFYDSSITVYACALCAVIDTKNRTITYSNAGGALPLFLNNSGKMVEELHIGGRPLGMMSDSVYTTKTKVYGEGDLIFFQTDGLCDSLYKEEPEVFVKKLSELILEHSDDNNPTPLCEIIEMALAQFYGDSAAVKRDNDDVSIIICRMSQSVQ